MGNHRLVSACGLDLFSNTLPLNRSVHCIHAILFLQILSTEKQKKISFMMERSTNVTNVSAVDGNFTASATNSPAFHVVYWTYKIGKSVLTGEFLNFAGENIDKLPSFFVFFLFMMTIPYSLFSLLPNFCLLVGADPHMQSKHIKLSLCFLSKFSLHGTRNSDGHPKLGLMCFELQYGVAIRGWSQPLLGRTLDFHVSVPMHKLRFLGPNPYWTQARSFCIRCEHSFL